jgi:hypothetical protein
LVGPEQAVVLLDDQALAAGTGQVGDDGPEAGGARDALVGDRARRPDVDHGDVDHQSVLLGLVDEA